MRAIIFSLVALFAAAVVPAVSPAQEKKDAPAGEARKDSGPQAEVPIPELPPDKLPPRTAPPPDPEKEQYSRGVVHLAISETVKPRDGDAYAPEVGLVQIYLAEYFRRAGYFVADDATTADVIVRGEFKAVYSDTLVFRAQQIGLKFEGSAALEVSDRSGKKIDSVEIPNLFREAITSGLEGTVVSGGGAEPEPDAETKGSRKAGATTHREESNVVRDLSREMASLLWKHFSLDVDVFADREIPALISSLAIEDFESDDPVEADEIIKKLAARRLAAVPYLLDALLDERPVLVFAKYPGLTALNHDKLRIYHIADKALEEVFQKVSRMGLDTPKRHRFIIIKGWENEWKRFCKPFRESPHNKKPPPDDAGRAK